MALIMAAGPSEYDRRRSASERFKDAFSKYQLHAHPLLLEMCINVTLKQTTSDASNGRSSNKTGVTKSVMYACSRFLDMSISKDVLMQRDPTNAKIDVNSKILALFPNVFDVAVRSSVLNHAASLMMSGAFGAPVMFSEYQSRFPQEAAECANLVNGFFHGANAQGGKIPSSDTMSYTMHEQTIARQAVDATSAAKKAATTLKRSHRAMRARARA